MISAALIKQGFCDTNASLQFYCAGLDFAFFPLTLYCLGFDLNWRSSGRLTSCCVNAEIEFDCPVISSNGYHSILCTFIHILQIIFLGVFHFVHSEHSDFCP